jgi:hypothetical protein
VSVRFRILSRAEALAVLQRAAEYQRGEIDLPPEIKGKREEIDKAIRNAQLFMVATGGGIDLGMIDHALTLRFELDALYVAWGNSGPPVLH